MYVSQFGSCNDNGSSLITFSKTTSSKGSKSLIDPNSPRGTPAIFDITNAKAKILHLQHQQPNTP